MPLSDQLREAITGSGKTVYAVAKAAGVSPQVLGRFLKGERGLTLDTVEKLAESLGIEFTTKAKKKRS